MDQNKIYKHQIDNLTDEQVNKALAMLDTFISEVADYVYGHRSDIEHGINDFGTLRNILSMLDTVGGTNDKT